MRRNLQGILWAGYGCCGGAGGLVMVSSRCKTYVISVGTPSIDRTRSTTWKYRGSAPEALRNFETSIFAMPGSVSACAPAITLEI